MAGGEGFSIVPDKAVCDLDIRLTRTFDAAQAWRWLGTLARDIDPDVRIEVVDHWPAYITDPESRLVRSFAMASQEAFGRPLPATLSPLSNIGNLMAARGVPTLCAPGVGFANIHATDESADIDTVLPVYRLYCAAARRFLAGD